MNQETAITDNRVMPIIRSTISKSKDGRYLIHRTTITHIKPTAYYQAVIKGKSNETETLAEVTA